MAKPFVKWVGGKRRLVEYLGQKITDHIGTYNTYYEPFLGSGALLLHLAPGNAVCSDVNTELISMYNVVKEHPQELIDEIKENYIPYHCEAFYYQIRELDKDINAYNQLTNIQRAARFIYLNKTCWRGLWRVNKRAGYFNVPWGDYVRPRILQEEDILEASRYFNGSNIQFLSGRYQDVICNAQNGDLVYLDPPYDIEEGKKGFVDYAKSGFNQENQTQLRNFCVDLLNRGVKVIVSNSNTMHIRNLYSDTHFFTIYDDVEIVRDISTKSQTKKKDKELVIIGNPQN